MDFGEMIKHLCKLYEFATSFGHKKALMNTILYAEHAYYDSLGD